MTRRSLHLIRRKRYRTGAWTRTGRSAGEDWLGRHGPGSGRLGSGGLGSGGLGIVNRCGAAVGDRDRIHRGGVGHERDRGGLDADECALASRRDLADRAVPVGDAWVEDGVLGAARGAERQLLVLAPAAMKLLYT